MFKKELKIFLIISFVLIGSLFFIQETNALEQSQTFQFGCHVGGSTKDCKQAFSFFGQPVGQVYQVDYLNLQNDRPLPEVHLCINNTGTEANGICLTVQKNLKNDGQSYQIDNVQSNALDYKYAFIHIRVQGEFTNDNDFNGLWTMHRRVVEIKNFSPDRSDVQTGGEFNVNWETDQAIKGVTLKWEGPVQGGSGSKAVGAFGPETFICSGSGAVQLTLTAVGPGENGEISRSETISVNCGSSNYTLTVSTAGGGQGTVTGPGINCGSGGSDCSETYSSGASVSLTATANSGSDFREWSGDCTGSSCSLTMTSGKNVTATFNCFDCAPPPPGTYSLTISKSGTGSGTVTGPGINCGADCAENYSSGIDVAVSANANSGSTFSGWSGDCGPSCNMNGNKNVTATFTKTADTPSTPPPLPKGGVRGYVWSDKNKNGKFDTGEDGIGGIPVNVTDDKKGNKEVARTNTDGTGVYQIRDLPEYDHYRLNFTVSGGYEIIKKGDSVGDTSLKFDIDYDGQERTYHLGLYSGGPTPTPTPAGPPNLEICPQGAQPAVNCAEAHTVLIGQIIYFRAWYDDNGDGQGWVDLTESSRWEVCNDTIPCAADYITDGSGNRIKGAFRGVTDGTVPVNANWSGTSDQVTLTPYKSGYTVTGYVYRDLNTSECCDGKKDGNEPNLPGKTVGLYNATGDTLRQSTVTDATGYYAFSGLTMGSDYRVTHRVPLGYRRTTDDSTPFVLGPDFKHDFGLWGFPPEASNVTQTPPNYCVSGPAATINWTYSDPTGLPQAAYQVQIDDQGSFSSPEIDTGKINSSSKTYATPQGILQFNVTYKARVRVWNSGDLVSDNWSVSPSWKTPQHAYPQVNFSWTPIIPEPKKKAQFADQTIFYDSGSSHTWSWNFGDSGTSTTQNQSHAYANKGNYNVTLTAADRDGQQCSLSKPINVKTAVPRWIEVAPR